MGVAELTHHYLACESDLRASLNHRMGRHFPVDDVMQETWIRARRSGRRPPAAAVRPWLFKIARHLALDEVRRRRPIAFTDALPEPAGDEWVRDRRTIGESVVRVGDEWMPVETAADLVEVELKRLPSSYREGLVDHYLQTCPYARLAAREGTSVQTVKSRMVRARRKLAARVRRRAERR